MYTVNNNQCRRETLKLLCVWVAFYRLEYTKPIISNEFHIQFYCFHCCYCCWFFFFLFSLSLSLALLWFWIHKLLTVVRYHTERHIIYVKISHKYRNCVRILFTSQNEWNKTKIVWILCETKAQIVIIINRKSHKTHKNEQKKIAYKK